MRHREQTPPAAAPFIPVGLPEVEISLPLPAVPPPRESGGYRRLLMLVRLHDEPLGSLEHDVPDAGLTPGELAELIQDRLGARIAAHLAADGREASALTAGGVGGDVEPRCRAQRRQFLEQAPPISVVVPSRERPERLHRCLESVLACDYPSGRIQIVIADNVPETDRTRQLADDLAATTEATVVYVRENAPGSASARNRGLQAVSAECVAMTDDDVLVDRYWLLEIARAFAAHPEAGAVSGLLWPAELQTQAQMWFEQYGGFTRGFDQRVFDLGLNRPRGEPLYPWNAGMFGTGNNFSFRTSVLRAIGGFDPALGNGTPALGGVDSEVLLRTILSGHQIVYEPRAIAHHAHRTDVEALRRQVYSYGVGLTAYYLKTILADPRFALDFARKLPAGLRWMLSSDSHVNKYKQDDYPSELDWLERRGMLYGPLAYARSRRRYGAHPVYGRRSAGGIDRHDD